MPYEPARRVLSVSFQRAPEEHANIIVNAERRRLAALSPRYDWRLLAGAVGVGASIGIAMELYRRYALMQLFDPSLVPPLNVVFLEFIPFVLLLLGVFYGRRLYLRLYRRRRLMSSTDAKEVVDTDIFEDGINVSVDGIAIRVDWSSMQRPEIIDGCLQFQGDRLLAYLPPRAFADEAAFVAAHARVVELWLRARDGSTPPATIETAQKRARQR